MAPRIDLLTHSRNRAMNRLHTILLATGSLVLLGVTAWAFGGRTGIVYAVVFGAVSLWMVQRVSPQMVLAMYKARVVSVAEFPVGVRLLAEIAQRAGLARTPSLHIIPSKMMNAFAVGRSANSAIAITDALARQLSARELAGVLAHEVSHIAHDDLKVMAFADIVARFTSFMSTVGLFSLALNLLGFAGGYATQVPWLGVLVLLAAPTVGGLLQLALSRTREFDADLGAALLTGDPDGLASALTKLEKAQGKLWEGLMLPGSRLPDPSVLRSHPVTAERVARLHSLKLDGAASLTPDTGLPGDGLAPPRPRPSLVPRIARHPGPSLPRLHALVGDAGDEAEMDDSAPAADTSLNPPAGPPRIRVTRGGVWW